MSTYRERKAEEVLIRRRHDRLAREEMEAAESNTDECISTYDKGMSYAEPVTPG